MYVKGVLFIRFAVLLGVVFPAVLVGEPEFGAPENERAAKTRPFYMGFTPFPYAISEEAVRFVYRRLRTDADILAHHFDDGIPWTEALEERSFHRNLIEEWNYRIEHTPSGHKILLAVTPINISREGLAPYKADEGELPLPSPWNRYGFDHPDIKSAFLNYCRRILEKFDPDWFLIGIEVNLLMKNNWKEWDAYLELHTDTYKGLKKLYPEKAIGVSVTGIDLLKGYTEADTGKQRQALEDILPHTDFLGISLYPYFTKYMTGRLPGDMFDTLFALAPEKSIAVTETGYPSQPFSIHGGEIKFTSNQKKQQKYIEDLLYASSKYRALFVINFVYRDYDELWRQIGGPDNWMKLWRDTGFVDEHGNSRRALETWRRWKAKPVVR